MNFEGIVENGFKYHPKEDIATLKEPQHAWLKKQVKRSGSGTVTIVVCTEKKAYKPGEGIQVKIEINNQSTCSVTLKYILYREQSRISPGQMIIGTFPIAKKNARPVRAHSKETIITVMTIPRGIPPTISTGSPIQLQYKLKVCLGMTGSNSAYIRLPIFVLPNSLYSAKQLQQQLNALTFGDVLYPKPNPERRKAGKRPPKPRSMDTPPHY
ncbi:arrestin domain-containing protein 3-like isoform X2 [Festucalex cinctus]